ncbi:hypothetical protein DER46DRAFT_373752 [Fusarium sp. MPI-SDFR-AT-0072]|uniref:Uncharacterized protein n=1 Tax=Fusarium oxysporum f. sp. rapae TaxID=485398 RepID=A0A8J5NKM1_FUSOX|nr:hypothetical protein Forpe1208_v012969 [Fusarium oxysporum f. sp. rapae]KAH7158909.1 hypothetical protein DER46DRAFT_373752 [Fusarium sp. MPI-SDFR-AT-0072]KAI7764989.1 hypothetical protein LZL87_005702 [Fusarium oxysporum]
MGDLANDINGFISQHNAMRGQRHTRDAIPAMIPSYYAPSLMLSERDNNGTPTQSISMSTASSSTFMSSCFDRPTPQTSSVYTEPPPVASLPQSQSYVTPSILTCEFLGFGDCDVVFDSNDESRWIAHIASCHLRNIFPTVCICWFCDREFRASSHNQADAETCYRKRMHHIAKHFRNGLSGRQMRPDFFLLDHLYHHRLINEEMYQRARAYHEASQVQIQNLYPAGWRPDHHNQEPAVVEASRSRHRGSSTRNRAPQGYYR